MTKTKKALTGLILTPLLFLGIVWGSIASQANQAGTVAEDIQKPGHVALLIDIQKPGHGAIAPIYLTSAAQQLDAATTSGGPTAAQNQKIQEMV